MPAPKREYDIEILAVENGYSAVIGGRVFVFADLPALTDWMDVNMKDPKTAKQTVTRNKKKTGTGGSMINHIDNWGDMLKMDNTRLFGNQNTWTATDNTADYTISTTDDTTIHANPFINTSTVSTGIELSTHEELEEEIKNGLA